MGEGVAVGCGVAVGVGMAVGVRVGVAGGVTVAVAVGVTEAVAVGVFVSTGVVVADCVLLAAGEGIGVKLGIMLVHPSRKTPTAMMISVAIG